MIPFIQNVAAIDIKSGQYIKSNNAVLIQITNPRDEWFPIPNTEFKEIHKFVFADVSETELLKDLNDRITVEQAEKLVSILQHALDNEMDVIVHCTLGHCRSGAVVEVGVEMGFQDTKTFRNPNVHVKKMMRRVLGWTYD